VINNQQTELKLVMLYHQELMDFLGKVREVAGTGKESLQRFLAELQRKTDIYEKQVLNYKHLFPSDKDIQAHESRIYFFRGTFKVYSGLYYDMYSGMFSPSKESQLSAAIMLFNKSLELNDQPNTRSMKVFCYRQLNDKKSALRELDYILEHHADHEEEYLRARKEKDELKTPSPSGVGQLFRSLFGSNS
jgi:hypothetical protein